MIQITGMRYHGRSRTLYANGRDDRVYLDPSCKHEARPELISSEGDGDVMWVGMALAALVVGVVIATVVVRWLLRL